MKITTVKSILGLLLIGLSYGKELKVHKIRSHEETETSSPLATTETPPVNVSSTLANYEGLNLIHNADHKTIGFVNVSENVGFSLTVEDESIDKVILDSKTGTVICYKNLNKVVLVRNEEFRGDILKSLKLILENFVFKREPISGNSSEIQSSSEDARTLWSDVYSHLGHSKVKGSNDFRSLKYLKIFARRLYHLYGGPLNGLIVGSGPFPLKQNLNRFITISIGLQELFGEAQGGLKNILSKNVEFEVNSLFNAKNGAEVLVYVFRQTGAKFDLSQLWGNLMNNVDKLLDIIGKLGGGETKNGVDETFAIISHFWAAIHLKIPITNFVQFLFESASEDHWSQADDGDLKQVLKDIKNITDEQSKKYDGAIKLSGFAKFFTNLTTNQLIDQNVNISELVEKWRKRDAIGGFKTISHLALNLFNPEKYSNLFFNGFIAFLNATSDPEAVKKILPGVPLENFANGENSVLNSLNKTYNIDEQLKKGTDPSQVFNGIPVFNEFSKTFKDSLGKDFDYSKILNGGSFNDYLSKFNVQQPFKLATDAFSKFIHGGASVFSHIFIDPIKHILPIPNMPGLPQLTNPASPDSPSVPVLPPSLVPSIPLETAQTPKSVKDESKESVSFVLYTTKKSSDEDSDDDSTESPITEKTSTVSSQETHLTGSASTIKVPNDLEVTAEEEIIVTTEKKCEDCTEEETKTTAKISTEKDLEFKNHHNRHHHERHQGHHLVKKQKSEHEHKLKNHAKGHENKHHSGKHQSHIDKNHKDRNHHVGRQKTAESRQVKSHAKNKNYHEEKHYQAIQKRHLGKHNERIQKSSDVQY